MTQPYGPYGVPSEPNRPTPPGPYPPQGPPAPYGPYGPPPPQGPGGYPPGGYGPPPPQPPRKNSLLPWIIVGAAVLVSGLGVLLVVLLTGDDDRPADNQTATSSTSSAPAISSSAEPSRESAAGDLPGDLPGGAQVAEPSDDGDGQFAGSGDVALGWVQAMADGDFQTAYDLSCAEVQDAADSAATTNTGVPAWELGTYFYEQTLSGVGFTDGTFDSVTYAPTSNQDMATFTLQMDDGKTFTLLVYVGPDLTVCDFF
jgi:hypothetical protein